MEQPSYAVQNDIIEELKPMLEEIKLSNMSLGDSIAKKHLQLLMKRTANYAGIIRWTKVQY